MNPALSLIFLACTVLVGWFAFNAWRLKFTVIAGQRFSREDSPTAYWMATIGWSFAFLFMAYLAIESASLK